jgi:hypothetical protein
MPLDYYLALLQLHIAVVGLVIAGIVALVQLLNNAKPHRDITLLVRRRTLAAYGALLISLLIILAIGSWVSAFPAQAQISLGQYALTFFADGRVALWIILLSLGSLIWFAYLAVKTRTLLDSQLYLKTYVQRTSARQVRTYLAAIYAQGDEQSAEQKVIPFDPFQPIREYIKENAFKYYDYGTADGLKHFSALFDKTIKHVAEDVKKGAGEHDPNQDEYVRLARYISESAVELFTIFSKTASEKRKTDTITLLFHKGEMMLSTGSDAALLPIVRGLEHIAKISDDDDEIIAAIERIRQLCDIFLNHHKKHDWNHVAGPFDEICLSVTRITETYYLQKNNSLKTVPIIGYSTGEHRTVTAALVDFFCTYRDLGDRYTDTTPVYYFEAIESVIEVLFVRLADIVGNGQQNIGFNMKYHELARDLYVIYYIFGIDAIEHNKPELLTLSLSNLRRVIKPAKNFKLVNEQTELCNMIVELAARVVAGFGDIVLKDKRSISVYTAEILSKHATRAQVAAAIARLGNDTSIDLDHKSVKTLLRSLDAN